jgi:GT2 family glycosyltransferase
VDAAASSSSFSIVVPTYGRPARLGECLRSITSLDYDLQLVEVLVVDDGSDRTDDVESALRPFRDSLAMTLIRKEHAGPAAARNRGAASASFDYLAFTDDDCRPDSAWLKSFAARLAESPGSVVGGRIVNALESNPYSAATQVLVSYLYEYSANRGSPFFASSNLAVPRDVFARLGGFDERFSLAAGEDRDFCDRCLHAGHRALYAPDAVVFHHHELTPVRFVRQHFNYGRGAALYHSIRGARRGERARLEPLKFYADLVAYPLVRAATPKPLRTALLLLLTQVANAVGFVVQTMRRERKGRP